MPGLVRKLWLGLAVWLAAAGLSFAAPDSGRQTPALDATSQQVLVMLRLPPEHFRPNSDYGGSYGDSMGRSARRRIAQRLARAQGLEFANDWPMPLIGVDCFVLIVPAGRSPVEVAARLSREPDVAWSEPMNIYRARGEPATHNDPLFRVQPTAREWRLAELHRAATGRNIRIAVIDSMIEANHPDLIGQIETSQNFVPGHANSPEFHGTAVAGVIAALADNNLGIAGVAPHARLMALRACWQLSVPAGTTPATVCDSLSLAKALDFAITHQAHVLNLSLSGPPDLLLGKLLDVAHTRHIAVVGAFDRDLPGGGFPASHPGVVAVADESWGLPPAGVYSAPGRDVPTTIPGGHWSLVDGSSFAAAQVSGLLALLREHARTSADPLTLVSTLPAGGGIDAYASLQSAVRHCDRGCSMLQEATTASRP